MTDGPDRPSGSIPNPEPPAAKHGLVGPFSGRQLGAVLAIVVITAVGLFAVTRPIAASPTGPGTPRVGATPFLVGEAKPGLQSGNMAPELAWTNQDGTEGVLRDLDGNPVRLADLRGKLVWLNLWASWCPPCQGETPVLRDVYDQYKDRGLALVGIAVQETTPDNVQAYADRYEIRYPIAFDASGKVFGLYKAFALPTQVLIGPDGRVLQVINGPMTNESAAALLDQWLPAPAASPPASPAGSATPG